MSRHLDHFENDPRISQLLKDFDKRYTGQDFGANANKNNGSTVTPDMLEGVN